ncbi:MAG: ribosome biogenesis GTPase YlqF [Bacilli bacterium]|nr:ribosome biogenesis GTPase YlqF [Bacilli bacterium]
MAEIHWFPGHMKKALNNVEEKIKLVDVIVELLDSRAPLSSVNDDLAKLIQNKKRVIVLSKNDLADKEQTKKWVEYFKKDNDIVIDLDLSQQNSGKAIQNAVVKVGKSIWDKQKARGMKPQPIKTMIIGIPNVGKSSLINRFAKRSAAGVENKPGFTRGQQWIKVSNEFVLLDTPGILPMNYENKKKAMNLALLGSIREDILPTEDMARALVDFLRSHYPSSLKVRFDIETIGEFDDVINGICDRRKLLSNGTNDLERAYKLLLTEFKNGLLGQITLEWL